MPFDGREFVDRERMLDKLDDVTRLLETEDKWCKNLLRTWNRRRRCILGALIAAKATTLLFPVIVAATRDVTNIAFISVQQFNDDPATDHRLVLAVLGRARYRIQTGNIPAAMKRPSFLTRIFGEFGPVGF